MKKRIFIILFICTQIFSALTQTPEKPVKFSGSFSTAVSSSGEATYMYYNDIKTRKKIPHGGFKYQLRLTSGNGKIYQNINGNYSHGIKQGSWSYKTTLRDYKEENRNDYSTGSFTLSSSFEEGIPHGKWTFTQSVKYREIESSNDGRIKWGKYTPTDQIKINMSFRGGMLTDTFQISKNGTEIVNGIIAKNGLLNGNWIFNKIVQNYENGFLVEKTENEKTLNYRTRYQTKIISLEKVLNENPENAVTLEYKTDTSILFSDNKFVFDEYIKPYVFENLFFLPRDIEGDNYRLGDLTGAYEVIIVNQVSKIQQKKINNLSELVKENHKIYESLKKKTAGKKVWEVALNMLKVIEYHEKIGDKYLCMANSLVCCETMEMAYINCFEACKNTVTMIEKIPDFTTRDEALDFFIQDFEDRLERSKGYEKLILERL